MLAVPVLHMDANGVLLKLKDCLCCACAPVSLTLRCSPSFLATAAVKLLLNPPRALMGRDGLFAGGLLPNKGLVNVDIVGLTLSYYKVLVLTYGGHRAKNLMHHHVHLGRAGAAMDSVQ